jgi:hypothetical protein
MSNTSALRGLLSSVLILSLVFPFGPINRSYAAPPGSPEAVRPWATSGSAEEIANGLFGTVKELRASAGTGEDFGLLFVHLSTSVEDQRLLDAAEILRKKGVTVTGTIITPEQMESRLVEAVAGQAGLAQALNLQLDRPAVTASLRRFLKKCKQLTFWTHIKKWKTQDWNQTTWKARAVNSGYALFAGSIAAAWFLWSASNKEEAFTRRLSDAAGKLFEMKSISSTFGAGLDMVTSLGQVSSTTLTACGMLTLWVLGYQTFFTAINSFRRQWVTSRFDPSRPPGEQLVLGEQDAYSRIFFFLSSVAIEMLICTGMLTVFGGGHIDWTLLWVSVYTSAYSAMGYMPAETLAGTFNQRAANANRLYLEHLDRNGHQVDELATVLGQAYSTNKTLEIMTRNIWWDTLYPAMRNATMLGASNALGNALQYAFIGFFGFGTALDAWKTRGSLGRKFGNLVRRVLGKDTSQTANCSDLIEVRSLSTSNAEAVVAQSPSMPE